MKKIISLSIFLLFAIGENHAQNTDAEIEKALKLTIDFACWYKEQYKDPKIRQWQRDVISNKSAPTVLSEMEIDKQIMRFNKSFLFENSPFKDPEWIVDFDDYNLPKAQLNKLTFVWNKLTLENGKEMPFRATDTLRRPLVFSRTKVKMPNNSVGKIVKLAGEIQVDYYTRAASVSFSKNEIGQTKTVNGVNITLRALENGYCRYEIDKKDGNDLSAYCYSKDKEVLVTNGAMSHSKILDDLLGNNYTYNEKTGCKVSDEVRQKYKQLFKDSYNKIYEKGTVFQIEASGTIDYLTVYVPAELKTKKYAILAYPKPSYSDQREGKFEPKQARYANTNVKRKFETLDENQLKTQVKCVIAPKSVALFSDEKPNEKRIALELPRNENTLFAEGEFSNMTAVKNGKSVKVEAKKWKFKNYMFNETNNIYSDNVKITVNDFDEMRGTVTLKYPASFVETTKQKKAFFDQMAFDKKVADELKIEEAKTDEQREKEFRESTPEDDEKREQAEKAEAERVYPLILKTPSLISVLQNASTTTDKDTYQVIRAFDKEGLELKAESSINTESKNGKVYKDYFFWGEIESLKLYEINKWLTTSVPFQIK
jgi:hypothetical protein